MDPKKIALYQKIYKRIKEFQKPLYVGPLSWFDRAVLSIKYPPSALYAEAA